MINVFDIQTHVMKIRMHYMNCTDYLVQDMVYWLPGSGYGVLTTSFRMYYTGYLVQDMVYCYLVQDIVY